MPEPTGSSPFEPTARPPAEPRWTRWGRCLPVVLRLPGVLRDLQTMDVQRVGGAMASPALPDHLHRLWARHAPRPALDPDACRTVVDRLLVRGRPHQCLPRSLALFALLSAGRADRTAFCIGARPPHLRRAGRVAHAWVELDGVPFGEPTPPDDAHRILYRFAGPEGGSGARPCAASDSPTGRR